MTNDGLIFSEKQSFKQWWLWLILLSFNTMLLYGVFKQVVLGRPFGDKPMGNIALITVAGLSLLFTILFLIIRLETQIDNKGIHIRFFPFQKRSRLYHLNEISAWYVRTYSPIAEYGGWGLRYKSNEKAFNVSGNLGLQIEFKNNSKLLIGTNKPNELREAIDKLKPSNEGHM